MSLFMTHQRKDIYLDYTTKEEPLGDTDSKIDVKFKIEQTSEQINEYITNIAKYVPIENNPKIQEAIEAIIEQELLKMSTSLSSWKN